MGETEEIWIEKYRPKKLDEMVGQQEIVRRLKGFVEKKSLPHLLFAGPAGTGKTTAALCIAHELFGDTWRQNLLELNASVTPETPILVRWNDQVMRTNFGEIASKLFSDMSETAVRPEGLEVLSLDERYHVCFLPVSLVSRHRVNRVARIRYEGGEIRTSLDHSVIVIDEFGNLTAKKVEELRNGEDLISFVTAMEGKSVDLNFNFFAPQTSIRLKSDLVRKFLISEDHGMSPEGGTAEAGEFLNQPFGQLAGTFTSTYGFDRSGYSSIQMCTYSTPLAKVIASNFYDGEDMNASTKRVPSWIFSAPIEVRHAFLKGYMGDASGSWNKYVRYSSCSSECPIDISWLGRISGIDASHYNGEARISWQLPSYPYVKSGLLPVRPFVRLFEKLNIKGWKYFMRHSLYGKRSPRIPKYLLREFWSQNKELVHNSAAKNLFKLIDSPISTVQIRAVEVEPYDGFVYDFSVPGVERFWGGTTPVLLHNSDERGIDTIRTKVKDYARTRPIGNVPYKLILLDESDALTPDAQHALRRTMEMFTHTTRFILDCNFSSRIIEPIQSRCAVFRFRRLADGDIKEMLNRIAKAEKLTLAPETMKAIIYVSEGDMRKAINILQAAAALGKKVTEKMVYDVSATVRPEDVKDMLELALSGKFVEAREKLHRLLIDRGLAGEDVLEHVHREIFNLKIPDQTKVELVDKVGEFAFRITQGANERLQLEAMLAHFSLVGMRTAGKST